MTATSAKSRPLFYRKGAGPEWSDAGIDATNSRGTADSAWLAPIPAPLRATREQLTGIALGWMNALAHFDPKAALPVGDDCVRFEKRRTGQRQTHGC